MRTTTPSPSRLPTSTPLPVPPDRQSPSPQHPALYELPSRRPLLMIMTIHLKRRNHLPVQHSSTARGAGARSPWTDLTLNTAALTTHCFLSRNDDGAEKTPPYIRQGA